MPFEGGKTGARKKRGANVLVRLLLSAVFLIVLVQFIPAGDVWSRIETVSLPLWLGVFAAFLLGHCLAAAKWRLMIGGDVGYPRALKAHFAGLAANLALPGVAGGDLVRAGMVMKGSTRKTALALGSLADRLIDSAALLFIAAIGAMWLGAEAGVDSRALALAAALVLVFGVCSVVFVRPIARFARSRATEGGRASRRGKAGAIIAQLTDAAEEIGARPARLALCGALSIALQASFAALNALIAINLGAGASLAAWMFAWPLAKLVATLPISFGGLGVREASLAGLMAPLGVASAGVVAASLVWQSILYAAGALGAVLQAVWRREPVPLQTGDAHG